MSDAERPPGKIRSNLQNWKSLQEADYFEKHPCYQGLKEFNLDVTASTIDPFLSLRPGMNVVVIGCGYGRETALIEPQVKHVYGIDVSGRILGKASGYLRERGVVNFSPVLAEEYADVIPGDIDLVYSVVVMQHLTRDLVRDYFVNLQKKLSPSGVFLVQFLEDLFTGASAKDAELSDHEPSVSWNACQLAQLCADANLQFREIRTTKVTPTALWHWAFFGNGPVQPPGRPSGAS